MIKYRLASIEDNNQLIELTSSAGMPGETGLRIDRKPDFFCLLALRGETKVFVAVEENSIIGCICVSLQQVYVGEQVFTIQYVGDFKVHESYRNKGIGLQLCNKMADYVIGMGADLAFLNVSKGNTKPLSFFKNRPNVPDFENIGIFKVHQFIGKKRKSDHSEDIVQLSPVNDKIIEFFNSHYKKYQLGSFITREKLHNTSLFTIQNDQGIIAAMCLTDMMGVKQNVVTRLSLKMKILLSVLNFFSRLLGLSKMPTLNEPVRMMYIKYLAVNNHDPHQAKLLINHARNIVYEKVYSFVSIGLHEKDPLNRCSSGLFKITFNSVGMLLSIKDNRALIEKVKQGVPFEDYSLV